MSERRADKTTIADVARLAGVSTATAGRVLGGYGYTSEEIRDKVKKSADMLGYRPNLLARSLITGRSKTIGVVAGDMQSPFYASILRGISDVVRARGFGLIVTNSDESIDRELEAVDLLREKQVDGIIIAPCDILKAQHLHDVVASGCPVVQIDRRVKGLKADSVTVNGRQAAHAAVTQMILDGHSRIGVLAELEHGRYKNLNAFLHDRQHKKIDISSLYPSWQRLLGYIEAHEEAGIAFDPSLVAQVGSYSIDIARQHAIALLTRETPPSALFTTDGLMSAGAMLAISELDISIPQQLSVVCFDDLDWMSFFTPKLTAIRQPLLEVGEAAARLVLERLDSADRAQQDIVLHAEWQPRCSLARHPG